MADQAERVVLEAEDNVTPITSKANAGLESLERKATSTGEKLVRINDQTRSSVQRLITSLEKQADTYGKSGVEKLITQRDQLLQRYQREPAAIDAITRSYQKMIDVEVKAAQAAAEAERKRAEAQAAAQRASLGQSAAGLLTNPLGALQSGVGSLASIGVVGGSIAGIAAGLGAVAAAGFEAAKSLGEYGRQIEDIKLRTGLTTKEVGQFSYAARVAGQDASIFERMMRGLSQAADENSKEGDKARATMQRLGIDLRSITGEAKPTSQVMLEVAASLNKLPEGFERDAAAMDLFKRVGVEAIPVLAGLTENVKRAKELGLGATEEDLRRWEQYHQQITEAEMLWERFTRKIKEPLAAVVTFLFRDSQGRNYSLDDLQKRGVNLGQWAPRTPYQNRAAAATAGFGNPQAAKWEANIDTDAALGYTGQIEARRAGDAAVAAFDQRQGLAGQLKKAEEALRGMTEPKAGVSSVSDVAAYKEAEQKVESLKQQIEGAKKAAQDTKELQRSVDEFVKQMSSKELDPVSRIFAERDALVRRGANPDAVTGSAIQGALPALHQEQVLADKQQEEMNARSREYMQKQFDDYFNPQVKSGLAESERFAKDWLKERQEAAREQRDLSKDVLSYQESMLKMQSGPGGELETAKKILELRLQAADTTLDKQKAALDFIKQEAEIQSKADRDREAQVQAQHDVIQKDAAHLWGTVFSDPAKFPGQLSSTVRNAVLHPVTEKLGDMTANFLQPIFGGKDPVRVSTDQNTAATVQNSAIMASLSAVIAAGMGVHAPSVSAGGGGLAGISLPSISVPSITLPSSPVAGSPSPMTGGSVINMSYNPIPGVGGGFSGGGAMMMAAAPDLYSLPSRSAAANPMYSALGGLTKPGGSSGFSLTNLKGSLGNLQNFVINPKIWDATGSSFGAYAGSVLTSPAATMAGAMLATSGLTGSHRGTWGGIGMGAAGGALVGAGIGSQFGPEGALIGAGAGLVAGFGIGLGEKLAGVQTPEKKAHDDIKSIYGVDIPQNSGTIKQIVQMAQSQFGGDIAVAVRSPSVRQLVMLYSESTGQKMPLSASTPYAGSLVEQGGNLYQQASFQNNAWHTYASNLPTLGGIQGTSYPTQPGPNTAGGAGPTYLSVNLNGQPISPDFVAGAVTAGQEASYGRSQQAANIQVPGLMVA